MMKIIGIVFFLLGCLGIYWAGKRAFERRNEAGIEEFSSYGKAVGLKALEGTIKIAGWLSLIFGFLVFCVGWGMDR